jgi:hypothetical protein
MTFKYTERPVRAIRFMFFELPEWRRQERAKKRASDCNVASPLIFIRAQHGFAPIVNRFNLMPQANLSIQPFDKCMNSTPKKNRLQRHYARGACCYMGNGNQPSFFSIET